MTILDQIISRKLKELEEKKRKTPVQMLEKKKYFNRAVLSLSDYVLNSEKTGIIAEFKRKSPSRGMINNEITVEEVTTGYFRSGASALSVLTDTEFFGGSPEDLMRARELNPIPVLRKDFVIDEYQVIESRAMGADAILLIAAVLSDRKAKILARLAHLRYMTRMN